MYNINYSFEIYSIFFNVIMKRKVGKLNIYYFDYINIILLVYELYGKMILENIIGI